jgi:hypothetical protein
MIERNEMFLRVRGIERMLKTTNPTIPQTMVHVPCEVRTFIAMVKVNRWEAMQKMQ